MGREMKKLRIGLSLALVLTVFAGTPVQARTLIVEKKFSNCAALNKVYPGGVAKSAKWVNKGGKIKKTPVVNAKVYNENSSRDRDKDGIACEN
jgi:hypothetical protein